MEATIVHNGGTTVVSDFTFIEEVTAYEGAQPDIRVWYSEPKVYDEANYELYGNATIVEVTA